MDCVLEWIGFVVVVVVVDFALAHPQSASCLFMPAISSFISCWFDAIVFTEFATSCGVAKSHVAISSSTVGCASASSDNKITDRQTAANTQHHLDDMLTELRSYWTLSAHA